MDFFTFLHCLAFFDKLDFRWLCMLIHPIACTPMYAQVERNMNEISSKVSCVSFKI